MFEFSLPTHATAWKQNATGVSFSWDASVCQSDCFWFGFMMRIKKRAPFSRIDLPCHLEEKKIENRMFFGGKLIRQLAFVELKRDPPEAFRVVVFLTGVDEIINSVLFLGTYPGLTQSTLKRE